MPLLGKPLPHDGAREHVTGEAVYLDDIAPLRTELLVDVVGSPVAHGRIKLVEIEAASAVPGIVAIYTHANIPGENTFGPVFHDEELLATRECHYVGQPIVVLAGTSKQALQQAKSLVHIEMETLPAILTIDEAVAHQRFIGPTRRIKRGNVATALAQATHLLDGTFTSGGQEHFYLEPQSALAIPGEAGQLTIHSSTQNPTEIQAMVARCLGIGQNRVVCICRRMGGAFRRQGNPSRSSGHPGGSSRVQDPAASAICPGLRPGHANDRQASSLPKSLPGGFRC